MTKKQTKNTYQSFLIFLGGRAGGESKRILCRHQPPEHTLTPRASARNTAGPPFPISNAPPPPPLTLRSRASCQNTSRTRALTTLSVDPTMTRKPRRYFQDAQSFLEFRKGGAEGEQARSSPCRRQPLEGPSFYLDSKRKIPRNPAIPLPLPRMPNA